MKNYKKLLSGILVSTILLSGCGTGTTGCGTGTTETNDKKTETQKNLKKINS